MQKLRWPCGGNVQTRSAEDYTAALFLATSACLSCITSALVVHASPESVVEYISPPPVVTQFQRPSGNDTSLQLLRFTQHQLQTWDTFYQRLSDGGLCCTCAR